jgi:hypothetical protein
MTVSSFAIGSGFAAYPAAVATDGTSFTVAVVGTSSNKPVLAFAHVDSQDRVTLDPGARLDPGVFGYGTVSMVWTGDSYVIAYGATGSSGEPMSLRAAVLDAQSHLIRSNVVIATLPNYPEPALTVSNGRVLFTWIGSDEAIHARSLSTAELLGTLTPSGDAPALAGEAARSISGASNGSQSLITWVHPGTNSGTIRGRIVDGSGNPLTDRFTIGSGQSAPAAVWTGSDYVVAFPSINSTGTRTVAVRISSSGDVVDSVPQPLADAGRNELLASGAPVSGGAFFLWLDYGALTSTLRGDVVNAALRRSHGSFLDPGVPYSVSLPSQAQGTGVVRGGRYLMAWQERSDLQQVRVGRYDFEGRALDLEPLAPGSKANYQRDPHLASDGASAMMAWTELNPRTTDPEQAELLYAGFLQPGSMQMDVTLVDGIPYGASSAVNWNGQQYVVAWQSAATRQLMLARWNRAGQRLDGAAITIAAPRTEGLSRKAGDASPALAWNGHEYFLLYGHETIDSSYPIMLPPALEILRDVRGQRLNSSLIPTGASLQLGPIQASGSDAFQTNVVAAGEGFTAAWLQRGGWDQPLLIVNRFMLNGALSTLRGKQRSAIAPLVLFRFAGRTLVGYETSLFTIGDDATFAKEEALSRPVAGVIDDPSNLNLIVGSTDPVSNITRLTVETVSQIRRRSGK